VCVGHRMVQYRKHGCGCRYQVGQYVDVLCVGFVVRGKGIVHGMYAGISFVVPVMDRRGCCMSDGRHNQDGRRHHHRCLRWGHQGRLVLLS
jgi:hypothetical protein